jgi:hypothetical protein
VALRAEDLSFFAALRLCGKQSDGDAAPSATNKQSGLVFLAFQFLYNIATRDALEDEAP